MASSSLLLPLLRRVGRGHARGPRARLHRAFFSPPPPPPLHSEFASGSAAGPMETEVRSTGATRIFTTWNTKELHVLNCNYSLPRRFSSQWLSFSAMVGALYGFATCGLVANASEQTTSSGSNENECCDVDKRVDSSATSPSSSLPATSPPSEEFPVISNRHTARWRIFTDTARDLHVQGRFDEAEKYFLLAMEEAELGFGKKDSHVASACNNLAELYRVRKDFDKAIPLYTRAIELLKECDGPNSLSVGLTMHNLASVYLIQRRLDQAKNLYEEALKVKSIALGESHPEYSNSMYHLAEVYHLQGRIDEAKLLLQNSIQILEENGMGNSSTAVRRLNRLAQLILSKGEVSEAEKALRKALHAMEWTRESNSISYAQVSENLGKIFVSQQKWKDAQSTFLGALKIRQKLQSQDHFALGEDFLYLGIVSFGMGEESEGKRTEDAFAYYQSCASQVQEALRICRLSWNSLTSDEVSSKGDYDFLLFGSIPLSLFISRYISLIRCLNLSSLTNLKLLQFLEDQENPNDANLLKESELLLRKSFALLTMHNLPVQVQNLTPYIEEKQKCLKSLLQVLEKHRKDSNSDVNTKALYENEIHHLQSLING